MMDNDKLRTALTNLLDDWAQYVYVPAVLEDILVEFITKHYTPKYVVGEGVFVEKHNG
jgi:hypothetical protein